MNKNFVCLVWIILIATSPAVRAEDNALTRYPIVKNAINNPNLSAKISSDAQHSASAPKGSETYRNFIKEYFSGDDGQVNELGKDYQDFCVKGPGEGCGVTRDLLSGGHYEGCIGGVGEGCGGGRTPPPKN
jgi:hypothetical protein